MDIQCVGFGWLSKVFWFQSPLTSLQNEVAVLLGSSLIMGCSRYCFPDAGNADNGMSGWF